MQMRSLMEFWRRHDRFWITFPKSDTETLLAGEKRYWAHFPTNRNLKNFFRNLFLAATVLVRERPELILTTGAAVGIPFVYVGKVLGITTVYVESLTRVEDLSLSGKLVYPFVDSLLVQWPEVAGKYHRAQFRGRVA